MLNRIRAYFSTKKKKEAVAKLVEIKASFYKANAGYTRNLNELYNVMQNVQIDVPEDLSVLRGVDITTMFKTSYDACVLVLDVVDEGVNLPELLYTHEYPKTAIPYLDWRVNNYSIAELLTLYPLYIYLTYLHRANKEGILSLDEAKVYNKLSFHQIDFLKGNLSPRLRDEAIDFYVLLLQIEIGNAA